MSMQAFAILDRRARPRRLRSAHGRGVKARRNQGVPLNKEGVVKELSVEEVLRIAGGVPDSAALDELTYRAPQDPAGEPVDFAHLLNPNLRAPEPT
jgi:hypothetical protein